MSSADVSLVDAEWLCPTPVARSHAQLDGEAIVIEHLGARRRLPSGSPDRQRTATGTTDSVRADPLDEIRSHQRSVFQLIVQFQRSAATSASTHALLQIVGDIVDCAKANFASEERWLLQRSPRRYRTHCREHREVIAQLHAFHDDLVNGVEMSDLDLRHGLDALLIHYVVQERFIESSFRRRDKRASNKRSRLT